MSHAAPPLPALEASRAAAARALARTGAIVSVSAWVLLVLGGASLAVSLAHPLSASFAISVAVVIHGWIERRLGMRLTARDIRAPRRLAFNQLALGVEIAAYAAWQAHIFGPEQIEHVLQRPLVAQLLGAMEPGLVGEVLQILPHAVRVLYLIVGAAALIGCIATAGYYASRVRCIRLLEPGLPPHPTPSLSS